MSRPSPDRKASKVLYSHRRSREKNYKPRASGENPDPETRLLIVLVGTKREKKHRNLARSHGQTKGVTQTHKGKKKGAACQPKKKKKKRKTEKSKRQFHTK